ncbi:MAG: extracellular solute-binding protein [Burkholderiaceae bacterium]
MSTRARGSRRRALLALAALGAGGLGLDRGALQAAYAQSPDWDRLVEAAKKEGKLVFYHATLGSTLHPQIIKAFEARYGIQVEDLNARASEIRERIRTEQTSGRYLGDVTMNGLTTMSLQDQDGTFDAIGPVPNRAHLISAFPATNTLLPVHVQTYGILVNSRLVKPGDEPKSWKDLTDARYKHKILSDDVRALGGGSVFFFVTEEKFGPSFHAALAQNEPVFSREIVNDEMRVARGEYAIYIPELTNYAILMKDLPVRFYVPTEGAPYVQFDMALLKNAPHPNAARLFINFCLEPEAQLILANGGLMPVVQGVADKANPEVRAYVNVKLLGTTDAKRQDDMLALAKTIYH